MLVLSEKVLSLCSNRVCKKCESWCRGLLDEIVLCLTYVIIVWGLNTHC